MLKSKDFAITLALAFVPLAASAQTTTTTGQVVITAATVAAGNITPGDTAGYPATISLSGSYKLNSNLTPPSGKQAIVVTANDVVLDLNGFTIDGGKVCENGNARGNSCASGSPASYFLVQANERFVIKNGSVKGSPGYGIQVQAGSKLQDLRVSNNAGEGVQAYNDGVVTIEDCDISFNGYYGLDITSGDTLVRGVTLSNNGSSGIRGGSGVITGVVSTGNNSAGIEAGLMTVEQASVRDNGANGILNGSVVRDSTAVSNGSAGFYSVASSGIYIDDSSQFNTGAGFDLSNSFAHLCYSNIVTDSNSASPIVGGTALTGTHVTCP